MVIVAKTPLPRLLAFAEERRWRYLRLLSLAENSFNHDYGGETEAGYQQPMLNVLHREGAVIWHFWARKRSSRPQTPARIPSRRHH